MLSFANLIFLIVVKPYESSEMNSLNVFFEGTIYFCTYLILMQAFVLITNKSVNQLLGWTINSVVLLVILVGSGTVLQGVLRGIKAKWIIIKMRADSWDPPKKPCSKKCGGCRVHKKFPFVESAGLTLTLHECEKPEPLE